MIGSLLASFDAKRDRDLENDKVDGVPVLSCQLIPRLPLVKVEIAAIDNDAKTLFHGPLGVCDTLLPGLHFVLIDPRKLMAEGEVLLTRDIRRLDQSVYRTSQ